MMIVQSPFNKPYRYLQIVKNRFSGDVGIVPYRFDPDNQKYYELTKRELEALDKGTALPTGTSTFTTGGEQKKTYRVYRKKAAATEVKEAPKTQ